MKHNQNLNKEKMKSQKSNKSSAIEKSMVRTTNVTSYVFGAPRPYKTAIFIFIFSLVAGFLINFDLNNLYQNFTFRSIFNNAIIFGLILIGLPALLSALMSAPLAHLAGGTFYYRRSFLLAMFSLVLIVIILFFGKVLNLLFGFSFVIILIFAYALIISVRHSVLLATSNHNHLNSLPASINHTIFGYILIWFIPGSPCNCSGSELIYMFWFAIIFILATVLWIHIVRRPFKRNFNADGLQLMKHSLTQFTDDDSSGQVLEREFFSKLGQKTSVRLGVVCIKDKPANPTSLDEKRGENDNRPIKTLLVIPSLHPGPFGILGGGNLPQKLLKSLKGVTTNLMVFHGPVTHDYNPVTSNECIKLARATYKLTLNTTYSNQCSTFQRVKWSEEDEIGSKIETPHLNICAQRFGNGSVYIHTSSPESTDDIDYPTGEAVIQKAEYETKRRALFIDAHNCLEPGTGVVFFGSEKANNMLKLVSKMNDNLSSEIKYSISAGFASDESYKISQGLGPMGIQVLVIKCVPSDPKKGNDTKTNAYILLDGNNIIPGLREQVRAVVKDLVDDAEVLTTDNHVVNATMGGYNPVGLKLNSQQLISKVRLLVQKALMSCKPSVVGVNSGLVKNIKIFGQNTIMRLSTTINSTISIMRSSLIACQALAVTACWVIALL